MLTFGDRNAVTLYLIITAITLGILISPSQAQADTIVAPDGLERSYTVFAPKSAKRGAPVLFVLHGGGGSARQVHNTMSYDTYARRNGFIVIYPDAVKRHWNDGRNDSITPFFKGITPDDVGFLRAVAGRLIGSGQGDEARILVTGVSNGGMMTQRLMCQASDIFSGGSSIIAGLPTALKNCKPSHPRSILLINGDADPIMPWNGGHVGFRKARGTVLSGQNTFAHWKNVLGCTGQARVMPMPNRDKTDQSHATLKVAKGCTGETKVHMVRVYGGGHNAPGRVSKKRNKQLTMRKRLLGPTNMDFDAQRMTVRFLGLSGD